MTHIAVGDTAVRWRERPKTMNESGGLADPIAALEPHRVLSC